LSEVGPKSSTFLSLLPSMFESINGLISQLLPSSANNSFQFATAFNCFVRSTHAYLVKRLK
jgi:hypothetical protein